MLALDGDVHTVIVKALITRYSPLKGRKIPMFAARKHVPTGAVLQWGRVQIAEGGDRMACRKMIKPGAIGRDCTYVRVRLLLTNSIFHLTPHFLNSMKQLLTGMRMRKTNSRS